MRKLSIPSLLLLMWVWACKPATPELIELESIPFPKMENGAMPSFFANDSNLYISWVTMGNDTTAELYYSNLNPEKQWTVPQLINQGSNWFVNWADFPALVENQGVLLSHILQKSSPETFSYDVKLQVLPKGATQWSLNLPLHQDSTLTEHGFVSLVPYTSTSFFSSWLDGRETGGGGHDHAAHTGGPMSIRAAEVDLEGKVLWDELLDAKTCDCCQTSSAITDLGPVVVYRNRSDREIRDIAIARLVDGKWTEPAIIHADGWEISGCPVNGPKVVAKGSNLLVGWFTAPKGIQQVKFAFSSDAGASFGKPVVIESTGLIGRVDVALLREDWGVVSWMETKGADTFLYAAGIDQAGEMGAALQITAVDPSRKSGFPQLEVLGGQVYFAWTEVAGEDKNVRTARIPQEAFLF
ncbi:MAG: hypothetical protein RLZZ358_2403 [Bacteroidota bacterium]|jgi:hypothetical protein